jgi:hypothetical protein
MIENNDINLKKFLILSLFLITFISLDVLLQAVTEKNIFGMVSNVVSRHNSGIFGKEVVAGSYIQRFCIFALICLPLVSKKNHNIKSFITFSLILIFFLGILFSGNRMPLFMFFFSMFLIRILIKELRLAFSMGILFSLLIFIYTLSVNEKVLKKYGNFYFHSKKIITDVIKFFRKKTP